MDTQTMPVTFRFLSKRCEDKFSTWECPNCKGEQISHVEEGKEPPSVCMLCTYRPNKKQAPLLEEIERILKNALHDKVVHYGAIAGPILDVKLEKDEDKGVTVLLIKIPLDGNVTGWYPYQGTDGNTLDALKGWKIEI